MKRFASSTGAHNELARVYCICSFQPGAVVPTVELIDAGTDQDAIDVARMKNLLNTREVWEHHRLVARILPTRTELACDRVR